MIPDAQNATTHEKTQPARHGHRAKPEPDSECCQSSPSPLRRVHRSPAAAAERLPFKLAAAAVTVGSRSPTHRDG